MLHIDIAMEESRKIVEEEVIPEGMPTLENASLYVELEAKRNLEIQSEMLDTMRILKAYLDILKENNIKLMNVK